MLNLVTGKIGSGKSQVIDILKEKGFQTFKCDDVAKGMWAVPDVFQFLTQLFGKDVITNEGVIDKDFLRKAFMKEEYQEKFRRYENYIADKVFDWIEKQIGSTNPKEPIFIECAWIKKFITFITHRVCSSMRIFIVKANDDVRNDRLLKRGVPQELINKTNEVQDWEITKGQKLGNRIYYIDNSRSVSNLFDNVQKVLEECTFNREEQEEIFKRIYEKSPYFVKPNVYCYLYHNMLGCAMCPFPCSNSDKHYEEAMKKRLEKNI